MSLTDELKSALSQSGFILNGLTLPLTPPHLSTYQDWLASGRHAEMAYLATGTARAKRADPLLIFPNARSLLMVGLPYGNPQPAYEPPASGACGRIAVYAWGLDYHDVIPPRLDAVLRSFFSPSQYRIYTDTGPILERDYATQAGLGWIGKNTCLIHPRHGSYFLLGIAFLEAQLDPDPPFPADRCGNCQRCIDACPTSCILPDRTIDASRCISYLTIENKGPIPPELRPLTGDWVFGCDICQTVCPWNGRFAVLPADQQLVVRPERSRPLLSAELKLTAQDFNQKFNGTPILRARRRGYLRNVAVALGNQPDPAVVPVLSQALSTDSEPLVRGHSAWALGRIRTPEALQALQKAIASETDPSVRDEILAAL